MGTDNLPETSSLKPEKFSLFDPETSSCPYEFYRSLHAHSPVYYEPEGKFWIIAKYDDLQTALQTPETFSSVMERVKMLQESEVAQLFIDLLSEHGWEHVPTLQRLDPPEHKRHRKILDRFLTRRHAKQMAPRIETLAHELIDKFADKGECEFIEEFAIPLPGTIIAEQIGLNASEIGTFRAWAENMMAYSTRRLTLEEMRETAVVEIEMQHFLARMFEERRTRPREDIMSEILKLEEGDEPLTMHEMQNIMHILISGGFDTVTSALSHMMWQLVRFPDVTKALRDDRSLIPRFIEEGLRWEAPTQGLWRVTKHETELSGTKIPAGALCHVRYGAGNHDPAKFPDPARFDIMRSNARAHLSFGNGPHFCPGAFLARTELQVACGALLDRLADLRLSRPMPFPVHSPSVSLSPMKEIWIGFNKAA